MSASESNPTEKNWFHWAMMGAVVLGCAVAMSPNVVGPDIWGHVQYGRDALADRAVAPTTTYSYTAEGYRWINHENISEALMALAADSIGGVGLVLAKFLLSVVVLSLMARFAFRQGAGLLTVCVLMVLVSTNLAFHWAIRPQLMSFVYFTALVVLLNYAFKGWRDNWHLPALGPGFGRGDRSELIYDAQRLQMLWFAPVIFLFWANSHGGFVAGYCLYVAYLVCRSIEILVQRGVAGSGLVRRFALMAVVAGLATLVNPYGPRLHLWLLDSLTTPRPEIVEWAAPSLSSWESIELWGILIAFALGITFSRRSRDFTHLVVLTVTLWQSMEHQRHIPFFAILFGFWMPRHIESCFRRWRISRQESEPLTEISPGTRRVLIGALCLAYLAVGYQMYNRLTDLRVERAKYPVAALQYMADRNLSGRMVVTYNWAQYVIGAFGTRDVDTPGVRVAFDGRFRTSYPQEIIDMNFDFTLGNGDAERRWRSENSPPVDGSRVLKYKRPDLALLSRREPHSIQIIHEHTDNWVLLYQDQICQLWGRKGKFDDPRSAYYVPPAERTIGDEKQEGYVSWPALPYRGRHGMQLASDQP